MPKNTLQLFTKVALTSCLLVGIFQWISLYTSTGEKEITTQNTNTVNTNSQNFTSAYSSNYASVWVALSTNIGIGFDSTLRNSNGLSFYREVSQIWETRIEKKNIRTSLIKDNMLIIWDYLNLSRTDIKSLLDSSSDRRKTLEWFISQLSIKFKNSALSLQSLEVQKEVLVEYLNQKETEIETIKLAMEWNFSAWKSANTLANVDSYFNVRRDYTEAFTDIVFINQFLKQYRFLNSYNKWILDTLINNKQAIIDQTYVVIPDSWDQYLRPLELIFDEEEIKQNSSSRLTE